MLFISEQLHLSDSYFCRSIIIISHRKGERELIHGKQLVFNLEMTPKVGIIVSILQMM